MLPEDVEPQEELYRAIPKKPQLWKEDVGRPSSAIFKDSKGVSVDRDGNRTEEQITNNLYKKLSQDKEIRAIIKIKAEECFELDANVISAPLDDDEYHALILNTPENPPLKSSIAKKLSKKSKVVKIY